MSLKLNNLKSSKTKNRKRVGRGGKRGTYSGRGLKGQRARSGGKAGLKRLGLKPLMTQTHKLRGFNSMQTKPAVVNISVINSYYKDGEVVSPKSLLKKGLIKTAKHGVKILGQGKLNKKLAFKNCTMSESVAVQLKLKSEKSTTQKL